MLEVIQDNLPAVDMKQYVYALQDEMLKLPPYQPLTNHYFHGGMYCREVYRDAGVTVVGKVHKKEHFYIVTSGTILVTTDTGVQRYSAPMVILSMPGTKRAVYAETPAVCLTVHRTDAKTVEEAEKELVEYEENSMYDSNNVLKVKQEVLS